MRSEEEEEIISVLGQSIHTGLRKAGESHAADRAWHAITDMPDDDWSGVLGWAVWAMGVSGYIIVKEEEDS